jgi:seryl-tRNA synthetase
MLDIDFIRQNPNQVRKACTNKGLPDVVDQLFSADQKRRDLIKQSEELRRQKNELMKDVFGKPPDDVIIKGKELKEKLAQLEPNLREAESEYEKLMLQIPNVTDPQVPIGKDEKENKQIAKWGEPRQFDFEAKDHIELGKNLDILDLDRGVKVAGFRGYFLKGDGVLLHLAVMQYALQKMVQYDFIPVIPPTIVNKKSLVNSGHFPWGEVDIYKTYEDEKGESEKFLAGTSEVPLISYHQDETLTHKDLPKLYAGYSQCYRREIGSYGKDTKGVFRIHEFAKIEQVVICENNMDQSYKWHEQMRQMSEEVLQELNLPYQVLLMCTGDMGEPHFKKYDLEAWMPSRNAYGETMSDSIMTDFQARRANIRYQDKDGQIKFAHTLNNTAIASPRILIALLENHQEKDGSIEIPEVLRPFLGKDKIEK